MKHFTGSEIGAQFWIDFYKVGHVVQYDKSVTQIWSNYTPRTCRIPGVNHMVFFGLQYFIKEILQKEWDKFFAKDWTDIVSEYRQVITATLGDPNPKTDHLYELWEGGYLPLDIYALPEGSSVNLNVPALVITNTDPRFFWLPNYLETVLSNVIWGPCTSATTAQSYRKLFMKYAKESGETDFSFIDWMGHDFSERGLFGREATILSGMGHLLSFSGTDSVPAILAAHDYYHAPYSVGGSVPATEHSVMCAGNKENEFETFRRLIEDVYPKGVVSIVSDTWDLWTVLTDYMPRLKDTILARDGKVVIRPDSGDPVKILCGDSEMKEEDHRYVMWDIDYKGLHPAYYGVFGLLRKVFGTSHDRVSGLPILNKVGAIYGDSITLERADQILHKLVHEQQLSPYNAVFGIGSYTYQYVTRDTYGQAMKATAVRRANGEICGIFKCPVTDDGGKTSCKGIPVVFDTSGNYTLHPYGSPEELDNCSFRKVYSNGELLIDEDFETIRKRVRE